MTHYPQSRQGEHVMSTVDTTTVQALCPDCHEPVPVAISCEPTAVAGLVVAPGIRIGQDGRPGFVGGFHLVHQRSGQLVVPSDLPPKYLHRMAETIGAAGIDWTQPHEVILAPTGLVEVRQVVWEAVCTAQNEFLDDHDEHVEATG
jgi:hypothetical protein